MKLTSVTCMEMKFRIHLLNPIGENIFVQNPILEMNIYHDCQPANKFPKQSTYKILLHNPTHRFWTDMKFWHLSKIHNFFLRIVINLPKNFMSYKLNHKNIKLLRRLLIFSKKIPLAKV